MFLLVMPFGGMFASTVDSIDQDTEVEYKTSDDKVCAELNKLQRSCNNGSEPYLTVYFDTEQDVTYGGCPTDRIKTKLAEIQDATFVVIGSADRQNASGEYDNTALAKRRADYVVKSILPADADKKIYVAGDSNAQAYSNSINNPQYRTVAVYVIWNKCNKQHTSEYVNVDAAYNKVEKFYNSLGLSVWRDTEGNFNTARLVSDSVAAVALGTVGGIITSKVVKKNQIKQGFEDLHCSVGGQPVAGYGDEFTVGMQ